MTVTDGSFWLGPVCALLSSLTWALGSSMYASHAGRVGALEVNLTRALLAAPLYFAAAAVLCGPTAFWAFSRPQLGWLGLSVACSYVVGDTLFYTAGLRLGTPTALAIGSIYPVWSTLLGVVSFGEPLGLHRGLGTLLCVCGVIWLVLLRSVPTPHPRYQTGWSRLHGVGLAILTSLCWAGNTYSVRQGGTNQNPLVINAVRYTLAAFVLLVVWFVAVRRRSDEKLLMAPRALLRFLPVVLIEALFGSTIFVYAMTHTDLSIAAPLASLSPLFSVPIGLVLRTERLCVRRLAAIAITVAGVTFLVVSPKP